MAVRHIVPPLPFVLVPVWMRHLARAVRLVFEKLSLIPAVVVPGEGSLAVLLAIQPLAFVDAAGAELDLLEAYLLINGSVNFIEINVQRLVIVWLVENVPGSKF